MSFLVPALSLVQAGAGIAQGFSQLDQSRDFASLLRRTGRLEAREERARFAQRGARIRTAFAASGVDLGTGTPLDQLAQNAWRGELAAQRVLFGFRLRSERALADGRFAAARSFSGAARSALSGFQTLLDIPQQAPVLVEAGGLQDVAGVNLGPGSMFDTGGPLTAAEAAGIA